MSRFASLGFPLLGFGIGWGSWSLLDKSDLIPTSSKQRMYMWQLRGLRCASATLPASISASLNLPSVETLDAIVGNLESVLGEGEQPREPERVPFEDVLGQCGVQEQIEWLEEHVEEEIPFFFIADLFNAFANVHTGAFSATASAYGAETPATYESAVLVKGTFQKMLNGVIPFDVSVRVLAALAAMNKSNAAMLDSLHGRATVLERSSDSDLPDEPALQSIVRLHADYHERLAEKGTPEGDSSVPSGSVDAATLQLLQSLNNVRIRERRWYKPLVSPTGPFPALRLANDTAVKTQFCSILLTPKESLLPHTLRFAEAAAEVLKCRSKM